MQIMKKLCTTKAFIPHKNKYFIFQGEGWLLPEIVISSEIITTSTHAVHFGHFAFRLIISVKTDSSMSPIFKMGLTNV